MAAQATHSAAAATTAQTDAGIRPKIIAHFDNFNLRPLCIGTAGDRLVTVHLPTYSDLIPNLGTAIEGLPKALGDDWASTEWSNDTTATPPTTLIYDRREYQTPDEARSAASKAEHNNQFQPVMKYDVETASLSTHINSAVRNYFVMLAAVERYRVA